MSGCLITNDGCSSLASTLSQNLSHIRELDLSYNHPGDSAKTQLSVQLNSQHWKLGTLRYCITLIWQICLWNGHIYSAPAQTRAIFKSNGKVLLPSVVQMNDCNSHTWKKALTILTLKCSVWCQWLSLLETFCSSLRRNYAKLKWPLKSCSADNLRKVELFGRPLQKSHTDWNGLLRSRDVHSGEFLVSTECGP